MQTMVDREDALDAAFAALANPTRRAILRRLSHGEATVNDLAEPFEMSLPAVSKHLKVLEHAGLIERRQVAQSRPCRIAPHALDVVSSWVDEQLNLWNARFDRLEAQLQHMDEIATTPPRKNEDQT